MHRYIPALFTAIVWGSTFVATKHLLNAGVQPTSLMMMRFILAYTILWLLYPKHHPIRLNKEEYKFALVGLTGGSLYFLCEYTSLLHTSVINVSLITSIVPIISAAIDLTLRRRRPGKHYIFGSLTALVGVTFVVLSPVLVTGRWGELRINIIGDGIAFASVAMWSTYSVVLSRIDPSYSPLFVSRRLFFYAAITMLPIAAFKLNMGDITPFTESATCLGCLIYLGMVASATCMWLWNWSTNKIGIHQTNFFLYLLPVVSFIAATLYDNSSASLWNLSGTALILIGIFVAANH
ncbi:MAG: DMT family transporter [Marinilabiliaceae bacterium]|nr:DMT family transporter [Marinilabiliaceae bacterium]